MERALGDRMSRRHGNRQCRPTRPSPPSRRSTTTRTRSSSRTTRWRLAGSRSTATRRRSGCGRSRSRARRCMPVPRPQRAWREAPARREVVDRPRASTEAAHRAQWLAFRPPPTAPPATRPVLQPAGVPGRVARTGRARWPGAAARALQPHFDARGRGGAFASEPLTSGARAGVSLHRSGVAKFFLTAFRAVFVWANSQNPIEPARAPSDEPRRAS